MSFLTERNFASSYVFITAAGLFVILTLHKLVKFFRQYQEDQAIAHQYGCKDPPRIQNHRPLGVDRIEEIFRASNENRLMDFFLTHGRQTGWTQDQRLLGTRAYGTNDPANIEVVLSTNFKDWGFGPRRDITLPMFGDGIFTQEGEAWRHSREMLRPQFHHRQYADLAVLKPAVNDLLEVLATTPSLPSSSTPLQDPVDSRKQPERRLVDLQPLFNQLTLDTTTAFLFGGSIRSLRAPASSGEQTFAEAFTLAQDYVAQRFRLLDLYWLIGGPKFREACRKVHEFADQIIEKNLGEEKKEGSDGEDKYVFLRSLAEKTEDRTALRGQIVNILAAGRDTTACLLSWTFFLLVRHPQELRKLKAEIASTCPDGEDSPLTRDILRSMVHLQNVIKETLRLYPSVPINARCALKTTVLPIGGGPDRKSPVLIPKGSTLTYCAYGMHRRPDLYGMDAELFRPDRWLEENMTPEQMPMSADPINSRWAYLPFNGGPRICLGMDFALVEAAYTVVRILQRFPDISLPSGTRVDVVGCERQNMTIVISSTDGCKVDLGPGVGARAA